MSVDRVLEQSVYWAGGWRTVGQNTGGGSTILLDTDWEFATVASPISNANMWTGVGGNVGNNTSTFEDASVVLAPGGIRGVNMASAEFAPTAATLPGTYNVDYTYPSSSDVAYVAGRGKYKVIRLPFRWERIQPTLGAALNATELGRMQAVVTAAANNGMTVILDVHNYARFINSTANGGATLVLGGGTLTNAHLADLWTRLSAAFVGNAGIYGYGIMNEPHTLSGGAAAWETASQAVVSAIRATGDQTRILVPGYQYAGAQNWATNHPDPWITGGGDIVYEAHYYPNAPSHDGQTFDYAASTTYATGLGHASLAALTVAELTVFTNWLTTYGVEGFVGEIGWPKSDSNWSAVGETMYDHLDAQSVGVTYWATGPWWGGTYALNPYDNMTTPTTVATVIETHPSSVDHGKVVNHFNLAGAYVDSVNDYGMSMFVPLAQSVDEATISYDLRWLSTGTVTATNPWGLGGKLPGLCGIAPGQGNPPSGGTSKQYGWSGRGMWITPGAGFGSESPRSPVEWIGYIYDPLQPAASFGQNRRTGVGWAGTGGVAIGAWVNLKQYYKMNTVTADGTSWLADGIHRMYWDGVLVYEKTNQVFRKYTAGRVTHLAYDVFYGGGDASWAPTGDSNIQIDNLLITTP